MREINIKIDKQKNIKFKRNDNGQFNSYRFKEKLDRYKKC